MLGFKPPKKLLGEIETLSQSPSLPPAVAPDGGEGI